MKRIQRHIEAQFIELGVVASLNKILNVHLYIPASYNECDVIARSKILP